MDRRTFLTIATAGLARPLAAQAQQAGKVATIGVLRPSRHQKNQGALRQGLREHGYVEGKNLRLEWRFSGGDNQRFVGLARELVALGVDAIVTSGTPATAAAKQATSTIPIVMVAVGDPVRSGFVKSLARPGANITGLTLYADVRTGGKRVALLKDMNPRLSRVVVLFDPSNPFEAQMAVKLQAPAQALGVTLIPVEVREPGAFERAFALARREGADALYVSEGHRNFASRATIVKLAAETRLPAIYGLPDFAESGGLLAYSASIADLYRRSGAYLARILHGTDPADLPIEQPTKFELVINLKTAKALGLTIPPSLLLRADHVIE